MSQHDSFFEEQREQSHLKTEIVVCYLEAWCSIVWPQLKAHGHKSIKYVDLFSGPGIYDDGRPSTPLEVMNLLEREEWLQDTLETTFFEEKTSHYERLKEVIYGHPVFTKLRFKPNIKNQAIRQTEIQSVLDIADTGTFTLIDPFGYKDVSLELLDVVSRDRCCECLFFLSVSGIERNVVDIQKRGQFENLLGPSGYRKVTEIANRPHSSLEFMRGLIEALRGELTRLKKVYVLSFCFEYPDRKKPSHCLVFVSKHPKGFEVMRDIMIKRSIKDSDDFPLYMFSPIRRIENTQQEMFTGGMLLALAEELLSVYRGQLRSAQWVLHDQTLMGCPYRDKLVRKALTHLWNAGKIGVEKPIAANKRDRVISNKDTLVFPK